MALRVAYGLEVKRGPIRVITIEQDPSVHAHLQLSLDRFRADEGSRADILIDAPIRGDCVPEVTAWIAGRRSAGRRVGPAFVFLDQCGWGEVPLSLISLIMAEPQCEVFVFLEMQLLSGFLTDSTKADAITTVFGSDRWRVALSAPVAQRSTALTSAYVEALRSVGAGVHVRDFAMRDRHDSLVYRLFHCCRDDEGLRQMKRAMSKVDPSGRFEFSDKASETPDLFAVGDTDESVAERLQAKYAGQVVTLYDVDQFVLKESGLSGMSRPLRLLEEQARVEVITDDPVRRAGTFPARLLHSMRLRFRAP